MKVERREGDIEEKKEIARITDLIIDTFELNHIRTDLSIVSLIDLMARVLSKQKISEKDCIYMITENFKTYFRLYK